MGPQIVGTLRAFVFLILIFASASEVSGYALAGQTWPAGSDVQMRLQLGATNVQLSDGSGTWSNSASDALSIWAQQLDLVQFSWSVGAGAGMNQDGVNSVFFSSNIYGESFGPYVLAVTTSRFEGGQMLETDVIFNSAKKFNSYRGPQQFDSRGQPIFDFHRIALHEFGHVLGLDHPDEHGQGVTALMNSIIGDLDHLADDDMAGARFLYGLRITSSLGPFTVQAGNPFQYQITANNRPVSYGATGLPAGLSLDSNSGSVTGAPTQVGTFMVNVVAHGTPKAASGLIKITVLGPRITGNLRPPGVRVGDPFTYGITATNNPFGFEATGLPAGLTLNRDSGVISGTPTSIGTFAVEIVAHCALGDALATLYITVIPFDITSNPYPFPNAELGGEFKYQITANNAPTSYSAVGLPPGLELDSVTGLISGTASLSGTFHVTVMAHGARGDALGTVRITVAAALPLQPVPAGALKTFDVSAHRLAYDSQRSRLYASDQRGGRIIVIDTVSLSVVSVIKLPHFPWGISISADHSKLWIGCSDGKGGYEGWIDSLDLNTLQVLPSLRFYMPVSQVVEGPNNRLYASGQSQIMEIDGNTGSLLRTINPGNGFIAVSPDRNTLYSASFGNPATIWTFDISQVREVLREETDWNSRGYASSLDLKLSHGGKYLCFANGLGNNQLHGAVSTALMAADDVRIVLGNFVNGTHSVGPIAFSNDDTILFQAAYDDAGSQIQIFDIASFSKIGAIDLGKVPSPYFIGPSVRDLAVDDTGAYIFVTTETEGYTGQLRVYPTGRGVPRSAPAVPAHSVLNVSTRLRIGTQDNVGIGGFIITGGAPKKVMIRAIGPSLSQFGVPGVIADPALEVRDATGKLVIGNDNWNSHRAEVLLSHLAPTNEHESALIVTLEPGAYTAIVGGAGGSSGVALVEVYDLSATGGSKLANISTRGKVEAGDNVMIGGFIIGGDQLTTVVVRAIGPSLAQSNVAGALDDPMLEVRNGNGALHAQGDDWRMYQEQWLIDSGLAPSDDRESAMILQLLPGSYTAIVRGKDNSTGIGLVEVYNLQ